MFDLKYFNFMRMKTAIELYLYLHQDQHLQVTYDNGNSLYIQIIDKDERKISADGENWVAMHRELSDETWTKLIKQTQASGKLNEILADLEKYIAAVNSSVLP